MNVDEQVPLRTLLVEDNRSEAALVGRLLLMAGSPRFDVITVHQLGDALAVLSERRLDLVVLDLGLPDVTNEMDGVETIHEEYPDVPLCVLTGVQPSEDLRAAAQAAGAIDCLFKEGISPQALHASLHGAVRRARKQ
jgi:DNA-binding response OmpR family regulator